MDFCQCKGFVYMCLYCRSERSLSMPSLCMLCLRALIFVLFLLDTRVHGVVVDTHTRLDYTNNDIIRTYLKPVY